MTSNDRSSSVKIELPHASSIEEALADLQSSLAGLDATQVEDRLKSLGPNRLPQAPGPELYKIFLRQFKSPLIYVLLLAGAISAFVQAWSDAGFIFAVLAINAAIGMFQEYRAEKSAQALRQLISTRAQVLRCGEVFDIDAQSLVPGDIVLLESGTKVPADMRLTDAHNLTVDESVLTGESLQVSKSAASTLPSSTPLAERINMLFAGTFINTGRACGVVTNTGFRTELGKIATVVLGRRAAKAPLIVRMEKFTQRITIAIGLVSLLLVGISVTQGADLTQMMLLAVALAVSAIPEGLPVALTVALAVGMQRMSKQGVIVRRLVAVEALGSCTYIASDKTGTLTVNQLTVRQIQFPGQPAWEITGEGLTPDGTVITGDSISTDRANQLISTLASTVVLTNEAVLSQSDREWKGHGDSVDLALLVFAHKAGVTKAQCMAQSTFIDAIPYESEHRFSASLNTVGAERVLSVKGSLETLLPMCTMMHTGQGLAAIQIEEIHEQAHRLASSGLRVLAAAVGTYNQVPHGSLAPDHLQFEDLQNLEFVGLLAMSDPPRPEVRAALVDCRKAGITVGMITGDHPLTALAVAREVGLANDLGEVVTGWDLDQATKRGQASFDDLCQRARVFARVEPQQKLQIVQSLQRHGHFVAVTGDGANDAPALRAAQVGVAMGQRGTDIAKETSDVVITDDNFASIVAGVEQGRIAYANVRKVIFLLISTGAAEIVLFALTLIAGLPMPLLAVQLLWLNLVTNGIQDLALAFEPAEGHELRHPPRSPSQGVFDQIMVQRVLLSALTMGVIAFASYQWMLSNGWTVDQARNSVLLLMVLFENLHTLNSRSERISVFLMNPLHNKLLLFSVIAAQCVHIGAMYTPGLSQALGLQPVPLGQWAVLFGLAASVVVVNEALKLLWRSR